MSTDKKQGTRAPRSEEPITKAEWEAARERESLSDYHPCDHWNIEHCDCGGSCSCHWPLKPEDEDE